MNRNLLIFSLLFFTFINHAYSQELWGTTYQGGNNGIGVIYKTDINGENQVVIHSMDLDGYNPFGSLVQASNGNIYGMTYTSQTSVGTLYEYDLKTNSFSIKVAFDGASKGASPQGSLFQASNGKLYGMTNRGGLNDNGVLFEYDPLTNTFRKILNFNSSSSGRNPLGTLMQVPNGKLYGMTTYGGSNGNGVLFEYNPSDDSFIKKVDFGGLNNGAHPKGTLFQASNGKLYGLTSGGGTHGFGILFEYDPINNILSKKIDFDGSNIGSFPWGSLIQASNGKLYGLTFSGGTNGRGVLFEYDYNTNILVKKVDFDGSLLGGLPAGTLLENSNGKLVGTTNSGGTNNNGVLFEYNINTDIITIKVNFTGANGQNPVYGSLIEVSYNSYTWTGTVDNDWENADNWSDSKTPVGTNSVVIPSGLATYPDITSASYSNNLTMESNASLIGQENLTLNGSLTIKREITGYSSSSNGWHFLSSPVSSQTIIGSDFAPTPGTDDLYTWGESTGEWLNYNEGSFGDTEFEVGKGYLAAYDNTTIKVFNGSFNTGSVTKNLSYTSGMGDGWNLIGNPYPSAIDWDLVTRSGDVDNAVYIVNPIDGTYKSWVDGAGDLSNGEIPLNQGFFVKANSPGQSVTMDLADQLHSSNNFNKSEKNQAENTLTINLKGKTSENKTYVRFKSTTSHQYDSQSDAYKLFGFAEIPQVYTHLNEVDYSINSLNFSNEAISIPVGIYLNEDEDLSFEIDGIEGFNENIRIELEDKIENHIVDLRTQSKYNFRGTTSDEAERFLLHFSQVTGLENTETQEVQVYAVDGRVYIRLEKGSSYSKLAIYDLSGRLVVEKSISNQNLQSFDLTELKGVYLVQLNGESGSITDKVTL